jgi:peptide/nickel transport system permease protein
MTRFLVRRLLNYVALCLIATFLAFSLASLTFNPLASLEERSPRPPQAVIDAKRTELRLDEPIPERFVGWISGVATGDFGTTVTGAPLTDQLISRIGVSLRLFVVGTTVGIVAGVLIGVAGAIRQYRFGDYAATVASFVILSTPVFVLAQLLKFGGLQLNEAAGTTVLYFQGEVTPGFQGSAAAELVDRLQHLVLPTLAIALGQIALYSRYQRSAMLDVLGSDFLRTAQAKGLTRRRALFKHGLRTALIPMATLFAFGFGLLVVGGTFTERIFGWFGMGDWFVYGVQQQDTNIVATVTLFVAVCILVSGWLSDVLYAALDPRIRLV